MEGIVASGVQDRNCVIEYSGDRLSTSYHYDANFCYRHNRTQTITVRFFTICLISACPPLETEHCCSVIYVPIVIAQPDIHFLRIHRG